jgi:quinol-cytochrome oxidoreductase complex cytochrome b subunit
MPESGPAQPVVRGERLWRSIDSVFNRLNAALGTIMPRQMNPFAQTGAIANTTLIVALVWGVLLLFWYNPSVDA